jgi:uncharacterized sulfatase
MYEEITRIPFIVRWPGVAPSGAVHKSPVSQVDIGPTFLEAAGIDIPPVIEGNSLCDVLSGAKERDNTIFMEFNRFGVGGDGYGGLQPIRCAYDGRFKLVINLHYTDELYDMKADPEEMNNLIDSPQHADIRNKLHDRIIDWMGYTRDPFSGFVWENRQWRPVERDWWNGRSGRDRPWDWGEPMPVNYSTGLERTPDEVGLKKP